jgi:hypothetical protein
MRTALIVAFSLCCLAGGLFAQTAPSPPPPKTPDAAPATAGEKGKARPGDTAVKAPATPDATGAREKGAYASCVEIWDPATHMSRREWDRACRRVAQRLKDMKDMAVK